MPIPDFQSTMRPLLCAVDDGAEVPFQQAFEKVCDHFQLTEEQIQERLPSGTQTIIKNRVSWAKTYCRLILVVSFLLKEPPHSQKS